MRGGKNVLGAVEAVAFTGVVLADIWFLHRRTRWGDLLPLAFAIISFAVHGESVYTLGLSFGELWAALRAWRVVLIAGAVIVLAGCFLAGQPSYLLYRGGLYFVWCVAQQIVFENLVYRRLRSSAGNGWKTAVVAGLMFAIVHLPNPVLTPATLVWGAISTRLFERRPSVVAIALLQTLLSSLLIWSTPVSWNHQFRVGPGYWTYHARAPHHRN